MVPKVSVIVPVYNVEKYVAKCLDSLLNQTLKEIEVIIVNDGTKDKSGEICKEYIKLNNLSNRFYYYEKENGGLSDARNFGLKYAHGEYVCFLDSDDFIEPRTYEYMYNSAKTNNSIITECEFYYKYEKKKIAQILPKEYTNINDYIINSSVVAWNKLINRKWLIDKQIYFIKGLQFEDVNFFFKICMNIESISQISTINIPLINYVQRENSITGRISSRIVEIIDIYNDILLYSKKTGKYNKFSKEIEYKAIRNFYCAFYKKLIKIPKKDERKKCFKKFNEFIDNNFYNWKKNKYLNKMSITNIYLRLINKKILYLLLLI